jgi:hypothetical protein
MSTTGPLHPEQLTREKTLDELCVVPTHEVAALQPAGSKSRETGSDGEDSDSGGATINSRIVGVIKNSKIICGRRPSHTANRIYPAYNAMTKLA